MEIPLRLRHQAAMGLDHVGVCGDTNWVWVDKFGRVERFVVSGYSWLLPIASVLEVISILSFYQMLFKELLLLLKRVVGVRKKPIPQARHQDKEEEKCDSDEWYEGSHG